MSKRARKPTSRSRKAATTAPPAPPRRKRGVAKAAVTAETLAGKQREISISEFFAKNRHLLGFDNPRKALLTTVKEAVDNALDACEEAGILPTIRVEIEHLPQVDENRFRVTVEDNGPGIVRKQIDNIFGKLLYGSKFHRLKMSRGQQGIGISAAGMYGLMTTGKPMVITTRSRKGKPAHHVELAMDTSRNRPEVTVDVETEDFPTHTGTRVTIELEGRYMRGRTSIDEYIEQTAIANPHAQFVYRPPGKAAESDGEEGLLTGAAENADNAEPAASDVESLERTTKMGDVIVHPRTVDELPPEPSEIKPHPRGVELGTLIGMLKQTEEKNLGPFLQKSFCRVSPKAAKEICESAGLTTRSWVKQIGHAEAESVFKAIQKVRLMSPPMDCLAPIGAKQILAGLLKGVRAEFYTASTRPPSVYRGNPFQIEVGVAFGGELKADAPSRVIRFANRVPLLYQQSACSAYKAVLETAWRNYGLSQSRGAAPEAPLVVMIHMASVWVPFTSESKEAIADYDEIRKEMRLALQECGRKLAAYVRKRQRIRREGERRHVFERYIGEVAKALAVIQPSLDPVEVQENLRRVAEERTALADQQFDEDGNPIEADTTAAARGDADEHTIVLDDSDTGADEGEPADAKPATRRRGGATNKSSKRRTSAARKKRGRTPRITGGDEGSLF